MLSHRIGRAILALALLLTTNSVTSAADDLVVDTIRYETLRDLAVGDGCTVTGMDLGEGRVATLRLARFEVLAPDSVVLDGARPLETEVVLLRGVALDDPASQVFLGVSAHGTHGFIRGSHPAIALSTGAWRGAGPGVLRATRMFESAAPGGDDAPPHAEPCLTDDSYVITPQPEPIEVQAGLLPCRMLRLAVDTDYEYTADRFGGDAEAAAAYAITLFAADSEIYRQQLNMQFVLSYLRVWSENDDPYSGGAVGDTLGEFRTHWNAAQTHVPRDLAHVLSGGSGGGVAWVGVVCHPTYGYAASVVNGSFPMPVQSNHSGNWDLVVTCHEIGHNVGTGHTHGYDPPIDNCAGGECETASEGTLMSYCHLCPGGIANMALAFHPIVRDTIAAYLESTCDLTTSPTPVALDDSAQLILGGTLEIDVLLNDLAGSCDQTGIAIGAYDPVSAEGGTIQLVPAASGPLDRDLLEYTSPDGHAGLDTFTYRHPGGAAATVTIDIVPLRPADGPGNASGAAVNYYALPGGIGALPDFDTLEPASSDVVDLVDFASTNGAFATSGLSDNVGAVFTGAVLVPTDGIYTLYTNSDDGSKLYVGDQLVVDNDGLHGMVEIGGQIPLEAGAHDVRVEFFEAGGGAGLIVSFAGPDLPKQVVPAGSWSYDDPCPADLDDDEIVGLGDLLAVLAAWGTCELCAADLDQDGSVGFNDLLLLLAAWGPC